MKHEVAIHNFQTGETDYRQFPIEDWSPYIPQVPAAQLLYRLYIEMGEPPVTAAEKVLRVVTGNAPAPQEMT